MEQHEIDLWHMRRALTLAAQGQGLVEPNPMVGCVVARGAEIIGEGFHRQFGGPHAEVEALRIAGSRAAGATLYVTLEPCCHHGKTPPCTDAVLRSGVQRVVIGMTDPFPQVAGQGIAELRAAGLTVVTGLLEAESRQLNAPYRKLVETGRPWVIAKWAMTLDGKIATRTGASRWISNAQSRAIVHKLRGRVDAIIVGRQTALHDDPLLTARPAGPRTATRVVLDTAGRLASDSQLVRTARQWPVLVAVGEAASTADRSRLGDAGCEVLVCPGATHAARLDALLAEMGRRRWTNVLVEGGAQVLGAMFDARAMDEVHVFIASRLFGGATVPTAVAGEGIGDVAASLELETPTVQQIEGDTYIAGRVRRGNP
ncbi:MAG: bifunctional diaminohydroxyphosphoribosylaminopyrimidine deaminase/5-amino-6-(5-phosphoribosylamino)uracil reductase RibD [Thermoguttaceae bacterium]